MYILYSLTYLSIHYDFFLLQITNPVKYIFGAILCEFYFLFFFDIHFEVESLNYPKLCKWLLENRFNFRIKQINFVNRCFCTHSILNYLVRNQSKQSKMKKVVDDWKFVPMLFAMRFYCQEKIFKLLTRVYFCYVYIKKIRQLLAEYLYSINFISS